MRKNPTRLPVDQKQREQDLVLLAKYTYGLILTASEKRQLKKLLPKVDRGIYALEEVDAPLMDEASVERIENYAQLIPFDEHDPQASARRDAAMKNGKGLSLAGSAVVVISNWNTDSEWKNAALAWYDREKAGYFPIEIDPKTIDIKPDEPIKTGTTGEKEEGHLNDPRKQLAERVKDRPDLAAACLKFLDNDVTRPRYAILSVELIEARLERERELARERKARQRKRDRMMAPVAPR